MQKVGVLGGTFDPIHEGHLHLARQALRLAGLDQVVILPMARPAHRETEAPADIRFAMCRLALEGQEGMALSRAGMQPSVRYTADILPFLTKEFPGAEFYLILGADKLPSLPYWHEADKLFAQCEILCFPRTGIETHEAMEKARAAGARVQLLPVECSPYSSTMIRAATAQYEDAPGLNKKVLCYMAENGLYQPDFLPKLKGMMNPRRFRHTLGVRKEAVRLAALHGLPIQKAALAGLLHDCAKGMPVSVMAQIAQEYRLVKDKQMMDSGAMLHGPVGAHLAKYKFGIRDGDVLQAIRNHTIGRPGMSELELCIFVADATEENREDYDGLQAIRRLAERSLAAAALKSLQMTQEYLRKNNRPFFPIAQRTAEELEGRLTEQQKIWMDQMD